MKTFKIITLAPKFIKSEKGYSADYKVATLQDVDTDEKCGYRILVNEKFNSACIGDKLTNFVYQCKPNSDIINKSVARYGDDRLIFDLPLVRPGKMSTSQLIKNKKL